MKALLEEESDKMPIEEEIEKQVNCFFFPLQEASSFDYCIKLSNIYVTWFSVLKWKLQLL